MNSIQISSIIFAFAFGSALLGIFLRGRLPEGHISGDSLSAVKLNMGTVATMLALVLGLLVASGKGQFDSQTNELTQLSVNILLLDRVLGQYGSEANEARVALRECTRAALDQLSSRNRPGSAKLDPTLVGGIRIYEGIERLVPQTDARRSLQSRALNMAFNLGQSRWLMFQREANPLPIPLLAALAFWLAVVFVSYGVVTPPNATTIVSVFVAALSIACAVFLVLEMYSPETGVITVSTAPLRSALAHLGP